MINKYWPYSKRVNNIRQFLIVLAVYVIILAIGVGITWLAFRVLGKIRILSWLLGIASWCLEAYCLIGILIAVVRLLKNKSK